MAQTTHQTRPGRLGPATWSIGLVLRGVPKDYRARRQELADRVEARRRAEENPDSGAIFHVRRSRKPAIFDQGTAATSSLMNEDAPELAPEGIGLGLVWLKTVVDPLDRQTRPRPSA
jgi:hypothetical protein